LLFLRLLICSFTPDGKKMIHKSNGSVDTAFFKLFFNSSLPDCCFFKIARLESEQI